MGFEDDACQERKLSAADYFYQANGGKQAWVSIGGVPTLGRIHRPLDSDSVSFKFMIPENEWRDSEAKAMVPLRDVWVVHGQAENVQIGDPAKNPDAKMAYGLAARAPRDPWISQTPATVITLIRPSQDDGPG